jgi:hypothetical protein
MGTQDAGNAGMSTLYVCIYTVELRWGYQIEIQGVVHSVQMRTGFMKQKWNFKKSQELKGWSEKCKT